MLQYKGLALSYLGHDCFRLEAGGKVLYTDPFQIGPQSKKADFVTISHDHFDHLDNPSLARVTEARTVVVASENCRGKVKTAFKEAHFLKPGEFVESGGFKFLAVPAYNVNKFRAPGQPFHPRDYNGLGFLIEAGGVRVYHAGDTDIVEEMAALKDIDIALLPVSGTYVMTSSEAAEATRRIAPKVAVPMHWGAIVGGRVDAEKFVAAVRGFTQGQLLDKE